MELRKEYEEIRSRAIQGLCVPANKVTVGTVIDAVREAVTACQELADRPPRELSDAEIQHIFDTDAGLIGTSYPTAKWFKGIRAVIAAHIAKQREPETAKLRLQTYLKPDGSFTTLIDCEAANEMWVRVDSREIEVKLP